MGDKCGMCGRQVGDKCKLSPKNPEWETSVGNKSGTQVWETSVNSCAPRHPEWEIRVGDKCKIMRPKTPRVGDKWKTSVNSCSPRHPEWEKSAEDRCGRQVGDKCKNHAAQDTQSERQVWETSGRQV